MKQIGAAPRSSMKALEEIVTAVRAILRGENVTMQGDHVHLDHVQMLVTAEHVPPLYVGAMREKTLRLAGRVGDGTILTEMISAPYVRWAAGVVGQGMAETGRTHNQITTFVHAKVDPSGNRDAARRSIAKVMHLYPFQLEHLGIAAEADALIARYSPSELAAQLPDEWVDALSISGTPEQAAASVQKLADAGAGSIVLQPLQGDPTCLDEYIQYLVPLVKR
jgi:alkanesulfonate monooxygenase SsuD/methylene tetrahydromethanopterin reductase-like flavin-dependent oxidoreductase (luciferase family)